MPTDKILFGSLVTDLDPLQVKAFSGAKTTLPVTINNGASLSGASAAFGHLNLVGVIVDAAWDTNALAFQGTVDGVNYFVMLDINTPGTELSVPGVVASRYVPLNVDQFAGIEGVKIQSGTSAAPVNQVGATVITLVLI